MKILFVITKANLGGAQKRIFDLSSRYQEHGHDVTVGVGEKGPLVKELKAVGVSVHHFKKLKRSKSPFAMFAFMREIKAYLTENQYDIVHFNSSNTLPGARVAKKMEKGPKTLFTFRGLSLLDSHAPIGTVSRFMYENYFRYFSAFVDAPVFQCRENMQQAKALALVERGEVVTPGVSLFPQDFLPRDEARKALANISFEIFEDAFLMGSIGRLSSQKNYEFLIDMFPKILEKKPKALLYIIGEGPERARLEKKVKKAKLEKKIFVLGEKDDAYRFLKAFDVFVLPSFYEGVSVALTEARIARVPLLASNVGGNHEITEGVNGEVYQLGDEADFFAKLEKVIENTQARTIYPSDEKFTLKHASESYFVVYNRLLGRG